MDNLPPSAATPPTQTAPVRKRRRRWLRRLGWSALWIVTVYALFVVVENWRGRRAWNNYLAETKAIGEPMDPASVIPPPLPDVENFAMTPLFQPLFDYERDSKTGDARWRNPAAKEAVERVTPHGQIGAKKPRNGSWRLGQFTDLEGWQTYYRSLSEFPKNPEPGTPAQDVLLALGKFDKELALLTDAAARPHSRFPVRYEDHIHALMPHTKVLVQLARLTQLRSSAELSLGDVDRAYEDLALTLRLAESLEKEPTLIAQLVRVSIFHVAIQPLWEGVMRHQWNEKQLVELQNRLAAINTAASYQLAMRGERHVYAFGTLDSLRSNPNQLQMLAQPGSGGGSPSFNLVPLAPQGWIDQNKVSLGRFIQDAITSVNIDPVHFNPERVREIDRKLRLSTGPLGYVYTILARLSGGAGLTVQQSMARTQGAADLALIAVMLERHRLRHQQYPASLAELDEDLRKTPRGVPPDCVTGAPPHYGLQPDGSYTLYYQGWNGTDDGGQVGREKEGSDSVDLSKGDWVWPQPVEP